MQIVSGSLGIKKDADAEGEDGAPAESVIKADAPTGAEAAPEPVEASAEAPAEAPAETVTAEGGDN